MATFGTAIDFLIAAKRCEMQSLEHLLDMSRLVGHISNMIHALQRERGLSNLHISFHRIEFETELLEMQAQSRLASEQFYTCLAGLNTDTMSSHGGARLFSRLAYAMHRLGTAELLRTQVGARGITPRQAIDEYSELIRSLLNTVFEAADIAADPETSRLLVALFNFMQGKEFAGQERACGVAGFAQGYFETEMIQHISHLIDSQERCFAIFAEFSDPASLNAWQALLEDRNQLTVERLRRLACTSSAQKPIGENLSESWFAVTSLRIDAMKEIENGLSETLVCLCNAKLSKARQDLLNHQQDTAHLSELSDAHKSHSVYYMEKDHDMMTVPGVGGLLGKSLLELLTDQSQRLQSMSEELLAAKAALTERKKIEKAKGILMQHRQMTEDQAHRYLRQLSMTRNLRLGEIADSIITMDDMLASGPR